ncbi:MAG: tRNA pseudouridine(38-40) synthase TruA [Paracoccaceae bacterium]|nr:tRNA pseudouridine(38-40) synthase TruA [Paracoccaceae bacterium]
MHRYALKIEYDGAPFSGWQRQDTRPSVQGAVEAALAALGAPQTISAAGRTDAGVHATAQVAMCEMPKAWEPFRLMEALNAHLKPQPVAILTVAEVTDPEWHPRFSAIARRYRYRILCRRAPGVLDRGRVWQVRYPLDAEAMQVAAKRLLGRHNFTTFRSTMCQAKSPVKTLDRLDVGAVEVPHGREIRLDVAARSFLHNQVRSFAGTLERVGAGAWSADDVETALLAKDRAKCGPVAPPQGLYLTEVVYRDPLFREAPQWPNSAT